MLVLNQHIISELKEYVSHPALHPGPNGEWGVWEALVSWIQVRPLSHQGIDKC